MSLLLDQSGRRDDPKRALMGLLHRGWRQIDAHVQDGRREAVGAGDTAQLLGAVCTDHPHETRALGLRSEQVVLRDVPAVSGQAPRDLGDAGREHGHRRRRARPMRVDVSGVQASGATGEPESLRENGEVLEANVAVPARAERPEGASGRDRAPYSFGESSGEDAHVHERQGPGIQSSRVAMDNLPGTADGDDGDLPALSFECEHLGDDEGLSVPGRKSRRRVQDVGHYSSTRARTFDCPTRYVRCESATIGV